jgi:OmpA-OmpF porin, OOP family
MKKLNISLVFAVFFTLFSGFAAAQESSDNWNTNSGNYVRSGADANMCWNNNFWTPATASADCGKKAAPKAAAPVAAPVVSNSKVTLLADALFDFDKATLKPEGIAKLTSLTEKLKGLNLEVIIVVGFTDSIGTLAYNKKLSLRRAEAVKAFFQTHGIEAGKVFTEGKAFAEPVADNRTAAGRALNRRAVVEVVGTRK